MIFLNYTLCQRQTESPSALLGGESGAEHRLEVFSGNAFSGVGHFDECRAVVVAGGHVETSLALHGVDSVLAQVFNHPCEQRTAEHHVAVVVGEVDRQCHTRGDACTHIVKSLPYRLAHGLQLHFRLGADFRESVGNHRQPVHVFVHILDNLFVNARRLEHLHPCH